MQSLDITLNYYLDFTLPPVDSCDHHLASKLKPDFLAQASSKYNAKQLLAKVTMSVPFVMNPRLWENLQPATFQVV